MVGVFLSGVNPTLAEMSDFMAGAAHISFTRWAAEAVTIQEMKAQPNHLVRARRCQGRARNRAQSLAFDVFWWEIV